MRVTVQRGNHLGGTDYVVIEYSDEDRMPENGRIELRKCFKRVVGVYNKRERAEAAEREEGWDA